MMEQLQAALIAITVLRSNVDRVFGIFLNDLHSGEQNKQVAYLQGLLSTVNMNLRNVVRKIKNLKPISHPLYLERMNNFNQQSAEKRQINYMMTTLTQFFGDMTISASKSVKSDISFDITLGYILKAVIIIRGMMIEWIVVKGYEESIDLWTQSRHKVFRKVTENALAAILHFDSVEYPELGVQSFMIWFHTLINLFIEPCKHCGLHLNKFSPPTWRDFHNGEAYHEECKPNNISFSIAR
ncbi:mediator of RNA polymerase II transcription subunit 27-like [Vespula pensylvanica]|uniref:mediator of RNA polymerase II transcription subunit 27-like n=1 Tax=Vespula pensylvanica TaxID=30213 RepID=UPI001CB9F342|nr:mediator of RNA polymerase II transcription subunit 27-like [Vespula pensylvanica]